jgi:hypothetical protein
MNESRGGTGRPKEFLGFLNPFIMVPRRSVIRTEFKETSVKPFVHFLELGTEEL